MCHESDKYYKYHKNQFCNGCENMLLEIMLHGERWGIKELCQVTFCDINRIDLKLKHHCIQ